MFTRYRENLKKKHHIRRLLAEYRKKGYHLYWNPLTGYSLSKNQPRDVTLQIPQDPPEEEYEEEYEVGFVPDFDRTVH